MLWTLGTFSACNDINMSESVVSLEPEGLSPKPIVNDEAHWNYIELATLNKDKNCK